MKDKIGSLYLGLDGKKKRIASYSTVFLLRRSIFVAITFALFKYPEFQSLLMLCMSLLYISYIAHMYFYDISANKKLEMLNESFFVLLQYNLIVLTGMIYDEDIQLIAGYIIVGMAGLLLALNFIIIMIISIKGLIRKC